MKLPASFSKLYNLPVHGVLFTLWGCYKFCSPIEVSLYGTFPWYSFESWHNDRVNSLGANKSGREKECEFGHPGFVLNTHTHTHTGCLKFGQYLVFLKLFLVMLFLLIDDECFSCNNTLVDLYSRLSLMCISSTGEYS